MMAIQRVHHAWTAAWEQRLTLRFVRVLPSWIAPDHLSMFGMAGAILTGLCYAFSGQSPLLLFGAVAGLLMNWVGDTADGHIARFRRIERPRYGFVIDQGGDVLAELFIFLGIGFSPYARMDTACFALLGYWLGTLLSLYTLITTGKFHISHYGIGPTEIRLALIAGTLLQLPIGPIKLAGFSFGSVTLFDACFAAIFAVVVITYAVMLRGLALEVLPKDMTPGDG
jgi:phosphatidylglycerophosphate synthase